jgi:hypothetical protein
MHTSLQNCGIAISLDLHIAQCVRGTGYVLYRALVLACLHFRLLVAYPHLLSGVSRI